MALANQAVLPRACLGQLHQLSGLCSASELQAVEMQICHEQL